MDIQSKAVSAREHTAVATLDMLKGVAIAAVQHQLGLADDAVLSSAADVGADGSISVTLIELVPDAPAPAAPPAPAAEPVAAAPVVPPVVAPLTI